MAEKWREVPGGNRSAPAPLFRSASSVVGQRLAGLVVGPVRERRRPARMVLAALWRNLPRQEDPRDRLGTGLRCGALRHAGRRGHLLRHRPDESRDRAPRRALPAASRSRPCSSTASRPSTGCPRDFRCGVVHRLDPSHSVRGGQRGKRGHHRMPEAGRPLDRAHLSSRALGARRLPRRSIAGAA